MGSSFIHAWWIQLNMKALYLQNHWIYDLFYTIRRCTSKYTICFSRAANNQECGPIFSIYIQVEIFPTMCGKYLWASYSPTTIMCATQCFQICVEVDVKARLEDCISQCKGQGWAVISLSWAILFVTAWVRVRLISHNLYPRHEPLNL